GARSTTSSAGSAVASGPPTTRSGASGTRSSPRRGRAGMSRASSSPSAGAGIARRPRGFLAAVERRERLLVGGRQLLQRVLGLRLGLAQRRALRQRRGDAVDLADERLIRLLELALVAGGEVAD